MSSNEVDRAGERRYLAAKMLGVATAPAIVRNVHLQPEKSRLAVIEKIERGRIIKSHRDRTRIFQRLQEEFRMTQREIAVKLGKEQEVVANTMRLTSIFPSISVLWLKQGQLSDSQCRLLSYCPRTGRAAALVRRYSCQSAYGARRERPRRSARGSATGGVAGGKRRGRPPLTIKNIAPG